MLSVREVVRKRETAVAAEAWGAIEQPVAPKLVVVEPAASTATAEWSRWLQRRLNVLVAGAALVLAFPLMLVIAVLVKLSSPGPVLFTQYRVGIDRRQGQGGNWRRRVDYGGKLFKIYKFRTMYTPAPGQHAQTWAQPDDPRVTRIGRFLRAYRLDELPQLWNVMRGDMNIVGPRPEQPAIFMDLREQLHGYQLRQRVLPGITGWAQVNQSYDRDIEDVRRKLRYDLEYAARQSAMEDLRIMMRTLPVMLFRKGAL